MQIPKYLAKFNGLVTTWRYGLIIHVMIRESRYLIRAGKYMINWTINNNI